MKKYNEIISDVPLLSSEDIFRGSKSFYIHLSTDRVEFEGKLHMHEFAEMSHVLSGEAEHEIGGVKYIVHRGDVILIKPHTPHTFRPIKCDEPFVSYDMMLTKDFFGSTLDEGTGKMIDCIFDKEIQPYDIHLSGAGYGAFGELFQNAYSEFKAKEMGYLDLIRAYVLELAVHLMRRAKCEGEEKLSLRLRNAVRSTVAYLDKNFRNQLTLEELAARIYFSKDYLNKIFREATGVTVGAYVQGKRLDEACRLLRETDKTVTEVAVLSGFCDTKALYTSFKRKFKMTPGEYRGE